MAASGPVADISLPHFLGYATSTDKTTGGDNTLVQRAGLLTRAERLCHPEKEAERERETAGRLGQLHRRIAKSKLMGFFCPRGQFGFNATNSIFSRGSRIDRTKRRLHKSGDWLCSKRLTFIRFSCPCNQKRTNSKIRIQVKSALQSS